MAGGCSPPQLFHKIKAIFGPKNHVTIHSQVRGTHLLCFRVFDPPLAPQKTFFYEKAQNLLKFGHFQKIGFLGGPGGGFGFEPSKISLHLIIYYFWRVGG